MPSKPSNGLEFRSVLQNELSVRCRKNPNYSLRSFSKTLKISHSQLSRMLKGQRPITSSMKIKLSNALGLAPLRAISGASIEDSERLDVLHSDAFNSISDWYHDAILELPRLRMFQADSGWIARVLGISANEAYSAVERLKRLHALRVSNRNVWRVLVANSTNILKPGHSDAASRNHQKQIIEKASVALEVTSPDERDHTGVTLAISLNDLAEIRAMTKKYRRDVIAFAQRRGARPDQIYQLQIAFFPLTKISQGDPS